MGSCLSPSPSSAFQCVASLGRLPLRGGRLTFYQPREPSREKGLLSSGGPSQTCGKLSRPQLGSIFFPKPVIKTPVGLIQVQSQPLELEGGIGLMWTTQMELRGGVVSQRKTKVLFPKEGGREAWQRENTTLLCS